VRETHSVFLRRRMSGQTHKSKRETRSAPTGHQGPAGYECPLDASQAYRRSALPANPLPEPASYAAQAPATLALNSAGPSIGPSSPARVHYVEVRSKTPCPQNDRPVLSPLFQSMPILGSGQACLCRMAARHPLCWRSIMPSTSSADALLEFAVVPAV